MTRCAKRPRYLLAPEPSPTTTNPHIRGWSGTRQLPIGAPRSALTPGGRWVPNPRSSRMTLARNRLQPDNLSLWITTRHRRLRRALLQRSAARAQAPIVHRTQRSGEHRCSPQRDRLHRVQRRRAASPAMGAARTSRCRTRTRQSRRQALVGGSCGGPNTNEERR